MPDRESILGRSARSILILLTLASSLPFINQAFHIDDRIYLEIANNILSNPLFPYDYPPIFEGLITDDAASHSHLPLISYYLALVKLTTGSEKEWVYHLAFLVFPVLAVLGFYDVAQRYVRSSLPTACLLLVSPSFLVLAHTLMTDVPLLAFWILSISFFLRIANDQARTRDWILCSLSLLAASFISLISVGLPLLMLAYLIIQTAQAGWNSRSAKNWLSMAGLLALPLLLWLGWYLISYLHYDRFVLINTFLHISKRQAFSWQLLGQKGLSFVLNVGATFLFPLVLWLGLARSISARFFLLLFLFSFVPFYLGSFSWSWFHIFLFSFFLSSGGLVVWQVCWRGCAAMGQLLRELALSAVRELQLSWGELRPIDAHGDPRQVQSPQAWPDESARRAQESLLVLWFSGVLLACLFVYYSGSVRYSLLALPPVVLLWARALERAIEGSYFLRNLMWSAVVLTGLYSLSVAYADYRFAEVYRRAAKEIHSQYAQSGRTIWFTGEWGYRYYLEREGANVLPRVATGPQAGDIIVKPYLASPWVTLYDGDQHTKLLEQRVVTSHFPVRILDFSSHAGFYSTGWGILPFSVTSGEKWEWFNVLRVLKAYEGPIPEQEKHY